MKARYILGLLLGTAAVSQAAVTLTISAVTGSTSGVLTKLASSTGDTTSTKVWGILVDTLGNGFKTNSYLASTPISLAAGASTTLQIASGTLAVATDDVLIISGNLMVNTNNATLDGGSVASGNLARPTQIASVPYTGFTVGNPFAIVWFDATTLGGTAVVGTKYGVYTNPGLILPADGSTLSFNSLFVGAESTTNTASNTLNSLEVVPEPSAALLGAVGVIGLLRRRRI